MKIVKHLLVVLVSIFLFAACQKEFSVESGLTGGIATGEFMKDSFNNCQPVSVNGTYYMDSTLTDSNYVYIQVMAATPGIYRIFTDVNQNFSFRDSGYFASAGPKTIKLQGIGRPSLSVPTTFTVNFGTSTCEFTIHVNPPVSTGPPADYTFVGSPGNCTGAMVNGTFTTGTALNATNTVNLQVDVTTVGSYSIGTQPINGITFIKSGTFTTTGTQTVTLQGSGTPTTAGTVTVQVAGASACGFPVTIAQGTSTPPSSADSAWSFNQMSNFFFGPFDTAYVETIPGFGTFLSMEGHTYNHTDTTLTIDVFLPGGVIVPASYSTTNGAQFNMSNTAGDIYDASPVTQNGTMTIVITGYNTTTKVVTGTFSGTAENSAGASVPITNGKFRATVQ